mmetsp:Transcript_46333/g.110301  ORF Transcript_46333/g.110301 Transcript_46333/m.110301 type:complete len:361 (-) Transcript_46333:77-1159(-)|eukprot:CAMPEP_0178414266 /NCGR_PEP_ID=MMETSP0689_2-20121128/22949_1 /TAXON_ID=160604 /ORGANISM="Amphidinium massartii, Strain CS-259" /LENGTH=360 /DNA_ID=CAMNT_0020035553 /DNA_START=53 /DNA_END=1135 /DNA_ORIENTATION=-
MMPSSEGLSAAMTNEKMVSAAWCLFYAAGIIGALAVYGVLQEHIMTIPYGGEGSTFGDSVFLVFTNRVVAVLFALLMALIRQESLLHVAPFWKYLVVSLSNVFASTCQYEALKYVTFPVQMLGKSFKMMPVMLWGMIVSSKRYTITDWLVAAFVTGGVTEFCLTGPVSEGHGADGNSIKGFGLLALFLALDGLTSTMQEQMFKEHKTTKYNQMLYVNAVSTVVSIITLLSGGGLLRTFQFIGSYPRLLVDAFTLSVAQVAGQWFIYAQIEGFGALVFAVTMNVRQVVSIIISYIQYHHVITWLQVLGLILVFGALFYKSLVGFLAKSSEEDGEKQALLKKSDGADPIETVGEGKKKELNP